MTDDKKLRAGGETARSDARERAMHILYEADTKGLTGTAVLAMQVLSVDDLTTEIVSGVSTHLDELDGHIVECANGWTLARMPVIDRNVLRMAVFTNVRLVVSPRILAANKLPVLPLQLTGPVMRYCTCCINKT